MNTLSRMVRFFALLVLGFTGSALADYPERPVKLIVPFAPGGGADLTSRLISQRMPDLLGKQVVVDNRAGGASNIGSEAVARAAPDGYTLLLVLFRPRSTPACFPGCHSTC